MVKRMANDSGGPYAQPADMPTPLLDKVELPEDLRKLTLEELPQLCSEIRHFLIHNLSKNPGHFAS